MPVEHKRMKRASRTGRSKWKHLFCTRDRVILENLHFVTQLYTQSTGSPLERRLQDSGAKAEIDSCPHSSERAVSTVRLCDNLYGCPFLVNIYLTYDKILHHLKLFGIIQAAIDFSPDPLLPNVSFDLFNREFSNPVHVSIAGFHHQYDIPYCSLPVSSNSVVQIAAKLYVTTDKDQQYFDNEAFEVCDTNVLINIPDKPNGGSGKNIIEGKDGSLELCYVALKYAVDADLEIDFEPTSSETKVTGRVLAYYGKGYDYDQPADDYYVMLFEAKRPNFLEHGKLNLMRSVMAVPAKFSLIIEAELYDSTSALEILSGTYEFPVPRDVHSSTGYIKIVWNIIDGAFKKKLQSFTFISMYYFFLNDEYLSRKFSSGNSSSVMHLWPDIKKSQKYEGPKHAGVSIHKKLTDEMHMGHLRSTFIGETLARMLEYSGVVVLQKIIHDADHLDIEGKCSYDLYISETLNLLRGKGLTIVSEGDEAVFIEGRKLPLVYLTALRHALYVEKADWIIHVTDVGQRDYIDMCITVDDYEIDIETLLLINVKYADLKNNRLTNYTFSFEQILNEEGNTAVFLHYTHHQVCSIIRSSSKDIKEFMAEELTLTNDDERELGLHLLRFTEVLGEACTILAPHILCEYLYELCNKFNGLRSSMGQVVGSSEETSKLLLCKATEV
ncbi:anticodon-binding aminoacyl-tRNA synthetase, class 1a, partial [Tanacetum coccineum]